MSPQLGNGGISQVWNRPRQFKRISKINEPENWFSNPYPKLDLDSKHRPGSCPFLLHCTHDDVMKWKKFPRYWPFVWGIHRSPVNSPHKGQWRRALMFSLIYAWIKGCVNNCETGDLRRHRAHYDVIVMSFRANILIWLSRHDMENFLYYWLFGTSDTGFWFDLFCY